MIIRLFDIVFSFFALIFLSPVLILVSALVFIDTKGPIFFKQTRVGINNKDFVMFKFRSMHINKDKEKNNLQLTIGANDSRITKSGYFLRKYKIDELPQLINVLKGEMSLVGPRPEVRKYVELYSEEQKKVLTIKPGITDLASIYFIDENEILSKSENPEQTYIQEIMPSKIKLNMEFVNNKSLENYFALIFKTIKKIVFK